MQVQLHAIQMIVENIEASRLTAIETKDLVVFKKRRDVYIFQLNEKNTQEGSQIPIMSLKYTINRPLLKLFIQTKMLQALNMKPITDAELSHLFCERATVAPGEYQLPRVELALRCIHMDRHKSLHDSFLSMLARTTTTLAHIGC